MLNLFSQVTSNDSCFPASGAKAQDLQVPNSAATPVIIEMNYLRNHSNIIRAKLEAQAALTKERTNHVQLKLQVKQQKTLTDSLQGQIETLHNEKTNLQSNKTVLGKTSNLSLVANSPVHIMVEMVKPSPPREPRL